MHEAETRALKRAVILLVLISVARWAWSARPHSAPVSGDVENVLPELLSASEDVADEEARRSEPLPDGQRLDPNLATEVELDRLPGVGPSTARAIVSAREDGATFRAAEDLLSVQGIGPTTVERIRDFLDLSSAPPRVRPRGPSTGDARAAPAAGETVDLNHADLAALQTLPGIGPAIAERILVARREQLFTTVDDLVRVRGIGPATLERLRPRATAGPGP